MTKAEILKALEESREKFLDTIEGLSVEALVQPGVCGAWSIKDIMAHLSRWEAELVKLLWQAKQGIKPTSVHFSHVQVDQTNAVWHLEVRNRSLDRILEDFHAVRNQTMMRIEAFSDRDLTDAQRFSWLDGSALWEWIGNDSFLHEGEHIQEIKAWRAANIDPR